MGQYSSQLLAGYKPYSINQIGKTPTGLPLAGKILQPTTPAAPTTPAGPVKPGIDPKNTYGYSWWPSNVSSISDIWKNSGDPAAGNVAQDWWRSPDWPQGGDIEASAYNPYWGWQDISDVKGLYRKAEGPVSQEQFEAWPLEKTGIGEDWQNYFESIPGGGDGGGGAGGGAGGDITDKQNADQWVQSLLNSYKGGTVNPPTTYAGGEPTAQDMLARFGYTGDIGINPMEQTYLDAIKQLYTRQPTGLQTIQPAQDFYNSVLGGSVGVTGQPYQNAVYGATAAGALQNYDIMRKNLAEKFSERGGYFGGANSMAQSNLANQTSNSLNQILAGLNLTGFQNDVAARQTAASGLAGLGTTQQGISSQILGDIAAGGNLITQRDLLNRQQSQEAQGRAYQDYLNQQNTAMYPFQAAMQLLGYNAFQPIAQQPQPSPWGQILGNLLNAGTQAAKAAA